MSTDKCPGWVWIVALLLAGWGCAAQAQQAQVIAHGSPEALQGVILSSTGDGAGIVGSRFLRTNDGQHEITLTTTEDGSTTAQVTDANGNVLFDGPYDGATKIANVPRTVTQRLGGMSQRMNGGGEGWDELMGPNGLVQIAKDPSRIIDAQLKHIQALLQPTDDEWRALSVRVARVLKAQRAARPDAPVLMNVSGQTIALGGLFAAGGAGQSSVSKAMAELREVLKDEGALSDSIRAKIAGLHGQRAKAEAELQAAEKDLKELLTLRHEAILAKEGILD